MKKQNTHIEINGKRYGATASAVAGRPAGRSIDGVTRAKVSPATAVALPAAVKHTAPIRPHRVISDVARPAHQAARPTKARHPKPSQTLMRHVVKKPAEPLKRRARPQTSLLSKAPPAAIIKPKRSVASVSPDRVARAHSVSAHPKISHFAPIPIVPLPTPVVTARPVLQPDPSQPAPAAPAKPDIFARALERATSHELAKPAGKHYKRPKPIKRAGHRRLHYVTATVAVLLFAGFLGYQNMNILTFKVAANRAGFAATMPGYHPAGFAFGPIHYSAGNVALNYHSNSDSRHFSLTESPSTWDSASLLTSLASTAGQQYQTVQSAGRTIYLYGNNQAAWVNNGVLYHIQNSSALSTRQLAELAASM